MSVLLWVLVGLGIGWIFGTADGSPDSAILGDIALGICGALIGGLSSTAIFGVDPIVFSPISIVCAFVGASGLIALERLVLRGDLTP